MALYLCTMTYFDKKWCKYPRSVIYVFVQHIHCKTRDRCKERPRHVEIWCFSSSSSCTYHTTSAPTQHTYTSHGTQCIWHSHSSIHTGFLYNLDSSDAKSYRPISNLPELSKVLEQLVAWQLLDYINSHKLLPNLQSAYSAHHSM